MQQTKGRRKTAFFIWHELAMRSQPFSQLQSLWSNLPGLLKIIVFMCDSVRFVVGESVIVRTGVICAVVSFDPVLKWSRPNRGSHGR